jgi:hypothetical protein
MHFDLAAIPQSDAYKLLVSTVVPRPIALATTVDRAGRVNAAPFSFLNAVSSVYGRGRYARTGDLFPMKRISLAEWKGEEKDASQ